MKIRSVIVMKMRVGNGLKLDGEEEEAKFHILELVTRWGKYVYEQLRGAEVGASKDGHCNDR